jgi:hypothetical protein
MFPAPYFDRGWLTAPAFSHFPHKFIKRHIYLASQLLNYTVHIVPFVEWLQKAR